MDGRTPLDCPLDEGAVPAVGERPLGRAVRGDHREHRPPQLVVPAIHRLFQAREEPGGVILLHEEPRKLIEHGTVVVGEIHHHARPARQQHQPDLAALGQGLHEPREVDAEIPEERQRAVRVVDDQGHAQRLVDELDARDVDTFAVVLDGEVARAEVGHRLAVEVGHLDESLDILCLNNPGPDHEDDQDDTAPSDEALVCHGGPSFQARPASRSCGWSGRFTL